MKRLPETLVAGALVYLTVAACTASAPSTGPSASMHDASPQATAGNTSQPEAGLSGQPGATIDGSAIVDAMTNPVPEAKAYESGTRIRARWIVGDDGARQFLGWHDSTRDEDCSFQQTADGYRCLPQAASVAQGFGSVLYFADSNCLSPVLHLDRSCSDTAYALDRAREDTCPGPAVTKFYAIAGAYTGDVLWSRTGFETACNAVDTMPDDLYDLVGVALSQFSAAELQVE